MTLSSRIRAIAIAAVLMIAAAPHAGAQRRILPSSHPQAQLMGYYSAIMQFTPVGMPARGIELGGELTYIPSLSEDDRRVGFGGAKLEDTNRCPAMPRLRLAGRSAGFGAEVGYVPPATVCGVTANLLAAAVMFNRPLDPNYRFVARGSMLAGSLEAAITCSEDAIADTADQLCFGGNLSEDVVRPFTLGLDFAIVHGGQHHPPLELYGLIGMRRERIQFDVNFVNPTINNLPGIFEDHERLETTRMRMHAAFGAGYRLGSRFRLGAELFYAPGVVTTLRGRAAILLRRGPPLPVMEEM